MRGRSISGALLVALLAGALLAGAARVQAARERLYPDPPPAEDEVLFRSGPAMRRIAGAFSSLAADLYWIRAIQYYGGTKRRLTGGALPSETAPPPGGAPEAAYRQLYPMLDLTTSLDPRFNIAYRFGAVFLAEAYPSGPGRPDLSIALLEKGLRERPDKWEYMQDAGFVDYWYRHDYAAAAGWFNRAASTPGAPWWLRSLAATTLAEGGDRRSSRLMWQSILQTAEIDWLRHDAERRLLQLDALDRIDVLQAAVDRFLAVSGAPPSGWAPVVRAERWRGVPLDPSGTPYELGPDGRVRLSAGSTLFPLPVEPRGSLAPS
ncbi:MAG: hypothetical protein IT176_06765 [Acidobacteria bacterium]|nr:hypothetical protein [Acidobacteriota bacterium]